MKHVLLLTLGYGRQGWKSALKCLAVPFDKVYVLCTTDVAKRLQLRTEYVPIICDSPTVDVAIKLLNQIIYEKAYDTIFYVNTDTIANGHTAILLTYLQGKKYVSMYYTPSGLKVHDGYKEYSLDEFRGERK